MIFPPWSELFLGESLELREGKPIAVDKDAVFIFCLKLN